MTQPILELRNVSKAFPIRGGVFRRQVGEVKAVTDVNLALSKGETLGIVGESGCGKTTLGRTIVRLYEPSAGQLFFEGQDYTSFSRKQLIPFRREMQMIFQDPFASLNPRMTVRKILEEPLVIHRVGSAEERIRRVMELMELVGLRPEAINRFPHEFSGGQRQRIGVARALALNPKVVVADEAVSALDVSIQAQILNLLAELQSKLGLTYVFISHDLNVVRYISDKIAVMYLGRVAEWGDAKSIYAQPRHPYTSALLGSAPIPDPHARGGKRTLEGDVPSPAAPPPGCVFHTRCPFARDICKTKVPVLESVAGTAQHHVACHRHREIVDELKEEHP